MGLGVQEEGKGNFYLVHSWSRSTFSLKPPQLAHHLLCGLQSSLSSPLLYTLHLGRWCGVTKLENLMGVHRARCSLFHCLAVQTCRVFFSSLSRTSVYMQYK